MGTEGNSSMATGDPPDFNKQQWQAAMQAGTCTGLGPTYTPYVGTGIAPTTSTWWYPPGTIQPVTNPYLGGPISLSGYNWGSQTDPLDAFMTLIGQNFIMIRGSFTIKGNGREYSIEEVLNSCQHVRYLKKNSDMVIDKAVWDALMTFVKCEDGYAGLSPAEYLDKIFSPKIVETKLGSTT